MDLLPLTAGGPPAPCTRAEALARLQGGGAFAWYRRWRRGALVEVRAVQVPYHLFHVRVRNAGRVCDLWLAADAVTGTLDLYGFGAAPGAGELDPSPACRRLPVSKPPATLASVVEECVRRHVYSRGFFQLRSLRIEVEDAGRTLFVPYWVGLYRRGRALSIDVVGGLRRGREGARLRDVLAPWFAAPAA
ncbi:MAG TPA: hypothetical protein VIG50_08205 [Vicinamibacteria bacterium]